MNADLVFVAQMIMNAQHPEDIFGSIPNGVDPGKHIKHNFRLLSRKTHPDFYPDQSDNQLAKEAFTKLVNLNAQAEDKLSAGKYGDRTATATNKPPMEEVVIKGVYIRYADFASGDIADLHSARHLVGAKENEVLIKAARTHEDNELLVAERDTLEAVHKYLVTNTRHGDWDQCIPQILDSFLLDAGTAKRVRVNVLEKFDGFLTVEQIHSHYPDGVDGRTVAWMWKRLMILLDWVHQAGYIHGAVLPPHIMYYPDNDGRTERDKRKHSVRLVDFCYSRKHRDLHRVSGTSKLIAWSPAWKDFYPPEVLAKKSVGPETDMYMAAKTMLYLIGGDVKTNTVPKHIEREVSDFLLMCLHNDRQKRPLDIRQYFTLFVMMLERVYGKPKYHMFNIPR